MATPQGALHRDLEQRLRKIEAGLREVTSKALKRKQLSVTQGDFSVSGGGDVVVEDGGRVRVLYPDGSEGVLLGHLPGGDGIHLLLDSPGVDDRTFTVDHTIIGGTDLFRLISRTDLTRIESDEVVLLDRGTSDYVRLAGGDMDVTPPTTFYGGATVNNDLFYLGAPTTGLAANLNYDLGNGRIRVVTSSRRFKENIAPADVDVDAALALEPKEYTRTDEPETPDKVFAGFIAEEAADLGLEQWVTRDAEGEPWAFDYSQWPVALQAIVRAQAAQIADLTARIEALEG